SMRVLHPTWNPYGSLVFGIAIVGCLGLFFGLRSVRNVLIFLLASVAAACLAGFASIYAAGNIVLPQSPEDFFIGGSVGAFVVVSAALFLLSAKAKIFRVLMQAACWSALGGALGVIGQNSGDWFGHIRSHFVFMHLDQRKSNLFSAWPNSDLALIFVWQTGMGLVIALALWMDKRRIANRVP
ncbi:MAG TPA: hypothetical protein VHA06_06095, partial [Candidatus Angelobacter sp.]|nr:hypothetical protein [Candidatus Angelobacter sp.]